MLDFLRQLFRLFINDGMFSRGASVAFYTLTSLAPLLTIIVILAGVFVNSDRVSQNLLNEFSSLVGQNGTAFLNHLMNYRSESENTIGAWVGIVILVFSASGAFVEIQAGLNKIWSAHPANAQISELLRARALSLALVGFAAFLLVVSLVVSAGLTVMADEINSIIALGTLLLSLSNFFLSYGLLTILFAAIYKFLPDTALAWRDVWRGGAITAFLFTIGKSLIGFYLGNAHLDNIYGAMAAPIIMALWIYYSAQIFFLGAEMTKLYAHSYGTRAELPVETPPHASITKTRSMTLHLSGVSVVLAAAAIVELIRWKHARSRSTTSVCSKVQFKTK